jgi:hypothetical protein
VRLWAGAFLTSCHGNDGIEQLGPVSGLEERPARGKKLTGLLLPRNHHHGPSAAAAAAATTRTFFICVHIIRNGAAAWRVYSPALLRFAAAHTPQHFL